MIDTLSASITATALRMREEDDNDDDDVAAAVGRSGVGTTSNNSGSTSGMLAGPTRRARSQRFSRAKTGCYTCRARRKKCDETRDATSGSCQRCLKSGIECLGFPKMRGAPLAAHSKKQKAEERVQDDAPTSASRASTAATLATNGDGVSLSDMFLQNADRQDGGGDAATITADDVSLSDFVRFESPVPQTSSRLSTADATRRLSASSAPQSALSSGPGSPINALGSLGDSLFSFAALASSRNASGVLSGIGSPLPSFSLDDWMPGVERNGSLDTPARMLAFPNVREEERAIKSLATFYGQFCWSWWIPRTQSSHGHTSHSSSGHRRRRDMQHIVHAIERRLRRSEIACTTVAAVAACYGFGNHITLNEEVSVDSFRQSWERIYEVVCDTKTSSLCAYLDWLGSSTAGGAGAATRTNALPASSGGERQTLSTTTVARRVAQEEWESSMLDKQSGGPIEAQADRLFSFASKVLTRVALAAKQDQDVSTDMSVPLEYAALVHVDVYLQAAMDLALFSYACRPASVFHHELDAAGSLLESLLGRGQSVCLSDIDGVEAAGFRTFAWADITNAVVSGRSTRLLYLFDDEQRRFGKDASEDEDDDGAAAAQTRSVATVHRHRKKGVSISFGCPDDVLIIFAHIANLHFQLRQARITGAIKGNGPEALPAWALHVAYDLNRRIEQSERESERSKQRGNTDGDGDRRTRFEDAQSRLAVMWRHAAGIFLHTTAYRLGPLGKVNQQRMRAILALWTTNDLQQDMVSFGNPALPLLFAAFVAQQPNERQTCRDALRRIGQHEVSRTGYRAFIERLWTRTDEAGFGVLWHDLLDGHESTEIAIL